MGRGDPYRLGFVMPVTPTCDKCNCRTLLPGQYSQPMQTERSSFGFSGTARSDCMERLKVIWRNPKPAPRKRRRPPIWVVAYL